MHRPIEKRIDALTPPALDVLAQRYYVAACDAWRQLTLRAFCALEQARGASPPVPPNVAALEAQCFALADTATVTTRVLALQAADCAGDAEPLHPAARLFRCFSEAELERLCAAPDFYAGLLELAPAYVDVDRPMREQGL